MNPPQIPPPRQVRDKYGVGALVKFGDPVTIPLPARYFAEADRIRAAVRSKGRHQGKRFTTRLVTIDGEKHLRIWRIE